MKYAFWPGCVALGGTPELYTSTKLVLGKLGIEVVELVNASCTGAGVLQEKNRKLGDTLNVRTFAQAEEMGLPIMTICSTCQGTMSQAQHAVSKDPDYLAEINVGAEVVAGIWVKDRNVIPFCRQFLETNVELSG